MLDFLMELDWSILNFIRDSLSCGFLDFIMPKITMLGDFGAVWIVWAVILVCTKKYRKQGIIMLIAIAVGGLLGNIFLKNLIARPRPCWIGENFPLLIKKPEDFSFPSGHTLASFISATILFLTDRRFSYAAIPLAFLIAFSRLYLYVHFFSDVIAGMILGVLIGICVYKLMMPFFYMGKKGHRIE